MFEYSHIDTTLCFELLNLTSAYTSDFSYLKDGKKYKIKRGSKKTLWIHSSREIH